MDSWQSWGRYPRARQHVVVLPAAHDVITAERPWLPRGNGRSYGDSCLNDGGTLVATRRLDRYIAFDAETGVLRCESGVQLADILEVFLPGGWFLPVTPGTKYVTVGGAIANDVHGKNHLRAGTFGDHVVEFDLVRSDGSRQTCSPTVQPELFRATIGGLGLTGLVTSVALRLRRVPGPWMHSETIRFDTLDEFFALSAEHDAQSEYSVAWVDCTARGRALGRGLFTHGDHVAAEAPLRSRPKRARSMFVTPPVSLVNAASLRAFNAIYWHRQRQRRVAALTHYDPFFYPLDGIGNWNRMYGPRGFLQYQCVVPHADARRTVAALLERIQRSGTGSFLAVLKQFGERAPAGMLSFARPGTTLAVDFPIDRAGRVFKLLDALDEIVVAEGGAVYPAKDARMSGDHFRTYFPNWQAFTDHVDPSISSGLWRRVMGAEQ